MSVSERTRSIADALNRLRIAARAVGVTLPEHLTSRLDARPVYPEPASARAAAAQTIADSLDFAPAKADKAIKEALDDVVRSDAVALVRDSVEDHLAERRLAAAQDASDEVLALFREALSPSLDDMNAYATSFPTDARPDAMSPEQFTAWSKTREAADRLQKVVLGTNFLSPVPGNGGSFSKPQWSRLGVLDLSDVTDVEAVVYALQGQKPRAWGTSPQEEPWFVAVARTGARFVLADAATRQANAEKMESGRTKPHPSGKPDAPRVALY